MEAIKGERTISEIAGKFEVHPSQIIRWKKQLLESLPDLFTDRRKRRDKEQEELIESFDFDFQPSIGKKRIKELAACRFIANGENVIFLGPPGVGKTHLAVALGIRAVTEGYRTYFTQAMPLIASLTKAYAENRIEDRLKFYCQPKLLIIDEIGYIPIDRHGTHLFFQLVSRRYEKGALILMSNRSFSQWNEIFGDPVIATAILDRMLHHSTTINIKGNSYRLKEKVKAGLIRDTGVKQ